MYARVDGRYVLGEVGLKEGEIPFFGKWPAKNPQSEELFPAPRTDRSRFLGIEKRD